MRKYAVNSTRKVKYTPEQKQAWKEEKMAEQKQLLEASVRELATSETWQNWIKFGRNNLRKYSFNNALLIWAQKRDAKLVHGRVQWKNEGVNVNADATPITILAPMFVNQKDKNGNILYGDNGKPLKKVGWYKAVKVIDVSETDAPEVENVNPLRELEGDELSEYLPALEGMARELGVVVRFKDETGSAHGWYDEKNSEIIINRNLSGNGIIRTLIHELCHAYGNVNYTDYTREEAEVLVESATIMALGMLDFDIREESVPYVVSWGGDLEVLKKNALLVDTLVKDISERMGL
jgi:hypothetical protein